MLTAREINFLSQHGLEEADVFDGRGMKKKEWQEAARQAGKEIILGTPCRVENHRLRSRSGNCIQCKPSQIAYQKRWSQKGSLYVANSDSLGVRKIGCTKDVAKREQSLRSSNYGGANDWRIVVYATVEDQGRAENDLQKSLEKFRTSGTYSRDGRTQEATEMFTAPLPFVLDAFSEAKLRNSQHEKSERPEVYRRDNPTKQAPGPSKIVEVYSERHGLNKAPNSNLKKSIRPKQKTSRPISQPSEPALESPSPVIQSERQQISQPKPAVKPPIQETQPQKSNLSWLWTWLAIAFALQIVRHLIF